MMKRCSRTDPVSLVPTPEGEIKHGVENNMNLLKQLAAVCTVFLWCQFVGAQQDLAAFVDRLNIEGPQTVVAGQLVRLTAQLEPNESPFWIVLDPVDLDYEQIEDGQRLVFAVGCQQRTAIVVLLLAQRVEENRIVTRQLRRRIEIQDDDKIPGPDDPVTPPITEPTPAKPPTDSPLFRVVLESWTQIPSVEAKAFAPAVAANFDAIADQCESGSLADVRQIASELSRRNAQALGPLARQWEPVGIAMQIEFKRLLLPTVKEHAFHLRAAAAAIRVALETQSQQSGVLR